MPAVLQPPPAARLRPIVQPSSAATDAAARVGVALESYLAGGLSGSGSREAFLQYLTEAATDRRAQGIRVQIPEISDASPIPTPRPRLRRPLPPGERADSGGSAIPGTDTIDLETDDTSLFRLYVERVLDKVFVIVETRDPDDNIEGAWIDCRSPVDGLSFYDEPTSTDGYYRFPLPDVAPASPLEATITAASARGIETFELLLDWIGQ